MSEPTAVFEAARSVELSRAYGEPDWLARRRVAAYEAWAAAPLPEPEQEDWRRTDLSLLEFGDWPNLLQANGHAPSGRPGPEDAAGYVAFEDSAGGPVRLDPELAAQGVVLCDLPTALREHGELVEQYFMRDAVTLDDENVFARLHAAFCTGGLFCYVPAGVEVAKPLLSSVAIRQGGVAALHHTLVVAAEGARVKLVEEYTGGGAGPVLSVPVVEVYAGPGAKVEFVAVQTWQRQVTEFATRRAWIERDADVQLVTASLGGKLSKTFVSGTLAGPGANANLYGCYFPEAGQHVDVTTLQDHREPNGTSNLLYKGALYERARAVFRGVVRVHPGAQQTDAYQTNNNLLLGDDARADSMPVLEIRADDVRCSHGATLAHLKDEELFYLRSRGLDREQAQRMVIAGFFEPILDQIPLESLRQKLQEAVGQRIAAH